MKRVTRAEYAGAIRRARGDRARAVRSFRAGFFRVADHYARRCRAVLRPIFARGLSTNRMIALWQTSGHVLVRCGDWLPGGV